MGKTDSPPPRLLCPVGLPALVQLGFLNKGGALQKCLSGCGREGAGLETSRWGENRQVTVHWALGPE